MSAEISPVPLLDLPYVSYIRSDRDVDPQWWGKIGGVYAIFDRDRILQYIGYCCNVGLSLK
jgi:hypothetical protein